MYTLGELCKATMVIEATGDLNVPVRGLAYDSRRVQPGDVFVCIRGLKTDGHFFAADAVAHGAIGIVAERELAALPAVPFVRVADTREALGLLAARFYDRPSHKLRLIGVTGTNGKTTTTYLIKAILENAGHKVGLIGTIKNLIGDEEVPTERTTPESLDLQALLDRMAAAACTDVVMEVSSHAIELKRIAGTEFDIGAFTNLTQDHLDFHVTFEGYRAAKGKFFAALGLTPKPGSKAAVINADDPSGTYYQAAATVPVVTYGIDSAADVRATEVELRAEGIRFCLATPQGEIPLQLHLAGRFNVYNALAAAAVALREGVPLTAVKSGLEGVFGVPGRFELIRAGQDFTVVVDYAHTPDGLENILRTAGAFTQGRKILVFGCGGNRDRAKRPIMGEIAGRLADYAVVTSDNPRGEDPASICAEVAAGVARTAPGHGSYVVLADRTQAIEHAINAARTGDIVLIAGKGHETYQIFADRTIHFDDREVAREALARRLGGKA